ncbi:MAG: hypothetical protein AAFZ18_37760 [Myxococcota bacterium]
MLRIGPFAFELWHLAVFGAALLFLAWVVRGFMVRIQGTWERVDEDAPGSDPEVVYFAQLGPFVRGRRVVSGGFQEYTGILRGRTMFMTRRDHGAAMIVSQGFPQEVVPEIDGSVTAKLRLTLSADGRVLFGTFTPQKIEFTRRPPAVTRRVFLDARFRRYRPAPRALALWSPRRP